MEAPETDEQTFDYWELRWENDQVPFHMQEPNHYLVAHKDVLPKSNCRFYVPLCGKTVDLVYLSECGYDVYGCEFIEKAVIDFFIEQNLEYTKLEISKDIFAYKATGKNITIYQGDFFALNSSLIGKFDAVWDRGSLVAINPDQKDDYAKQMNDLMAPNCKYLLFSCVIGEEPYNGPPYTVHQEEIMNLFGNFCTVKHLKVYSNNEDSFVVTISLLTKK